MSFTNLGLSAKLNRAVSDKGYSAPTPIQSQAIPLILQGRDIMGGSQTGSGKTAGFTLPVLQRLMDGGIPGKKRRPIRALVLAPTRELAAQVAESVVDYGRYLPLRSTAIYGGVSINPQKQKLIRGVDLLVATPGRLLDHVNQRSVDLSSVEMLVLDEADRMLDMGFIHDIRRVLALLPANKQTLLFSATFSDEIKQLANDLLKSPALVEATQHNTTAPTVTQVVHPVDKPRKRELLSYLIGSNNWKQVLVFSRTKHGADRLAKQLVQSGIRAAAIHGDKSQGARTRALADFKNGKVSVLVATDIAARGLDINHLPHVINFDLPHKPDDYVHRIGRTGRAGKSGEAISLVCSEEWKQLVSIEKLVQKEIPQMIIEGFEPTVTHNKSDKPGKKAAGPQRKPGGHRSANPRARSDNNGNGKQYRRRKPRAAA